MLCFQKLYSKILSISRVCHLCSGQLLLVSGSNCNQNFSKHAQSRGSLWCSHVNLSHVDCKTKSLVCFPKKSFKIFPTIQSVNSPDTKIIGKTKIIYMINIPLTDSYIVSLDRSDTGVQYQQDKTADIRTDVMTMATIFWNIVKTPFLLFTAPRLKLP